MKRSVLVLTLLAVLIFPVNVLAQVEAAITRGECGAIDVALMLRAFEPSTAVENASVSRTRVRSDLASLMERGLSLTLLDDGTVVACGAIPAEADESNADRVEVALEPATADRHYGYAILREFDPGRTTIVLAIPGGTITDEPLPAPVQRTPSQDSLPPQTDTLTTQPSLAQEELDYIIYLYSAMLTVADSSSRAGELFKNPRIGDDDWTIELATEFALWRTLYQAAEERIPPPRFAELHAKFTEMLSLLSSASYDMAAGADTLDPALVNRGAGKIADATEILDEMEVIIDELAESAGVEP